MTDAPQGEGWWVASDGKWYPPQGQPAPASPPSPPQVPSSDMQIDPDWWRASDGRWYPPTTSPNLQSPPGALQPTINGSRRSVSKGLSGTLQGFFWAAGGVSVIAAISGFVGLGALNTYWDARSGTRAEREALDDLLAADETINVFIGLGGLVGLAIFVLIIIWGNQAHKAAQDLWHGPRKWSSGWSVGGWFIPVANAIIPKLVLDETERLALAPRPNGVVADSWMQRATLPLGWVWWLLFLAGTLIGGVGGAMFDAAGGTVDSFRVGYIMTGIGYATLAASSVAGALYVRRISQALK